MIILQSRLSGMYFKQFGLWVTHAAEALHFESPEMARQFVENERVRDVLVRETMECAALTAAGEG
jgi:hypothetical protein